jgi:hypothetical protein
MGDEKGFIYYLLRKGVTNGKTCIKSRGSRGNWKGEGQKIEGKRPDPSHLLWPPVQIDPFGN